jgi:type IV pilus assembly protein PilA
MRRFPTLALVLASTLLTGFVIVLAYKHAWRVPVVRDFRGGPLVGALWLLIAPSVAMGLSRLLRHKWRTGAKAGALCASFGLLVLVGGQAFGGVRRSSQDKAILCNLRQLAAAADQFFLENNVTTASYDDLVGPDKYVKAVNAVRGENYRALFPFKQGAALTIEVGHGRTISYGEPPAADAIRVSSLHSGPRGAVCANCHDKRRA